MNGADELYAFFLETRHTTAKPRKTVQKIKNQSKIIEGQNFYASVKKIQKSAENQGLSKEAGTFKKNGNLYILDGFRILKSRFDFIGAQENPNGFDADAFFGKIHSSKSAKKMSAPSIPELKQIIKKAKDEFCEGLTDAEIRKARRNGKLKRVLFRFDNGLVVNADYLIDAISITGQMEFSYTDKKSPLYFKSSDGHYELALLPVNSQENFQGKAIVA